MWGRENKEIIINGELLRNLKWMSPELISQMGLDKGENTAAQGYLWVMETFHNAGC